MELTSKIVSEQIKSSNSNLAVEIAAKYAKQGIESLDAFHAVESTTYQAIEDYLNFGCLKEIDAEHLDVDDIVEETIRLFNKDLKC